MSQNLSAVDRKAARAEISRRFPSYAIDFPAAAKRRHARSSRLGAEFSQRQNNRADLRVSPNCIGKGRGLPALPIRKLAAAADRLARWHVRAHAPWPHRCSSWP